MAGTPGPSRIQEHKCFGDICKPNIWYDVILTKNTMFRTGSAEGEAEESSSYLCFREYNHRVPIIRNSPAKA